MSPTILIILFFVMLSCAGIVYAAFSFFVPATSVVEDRLEALTRNKGRGVPAEKARSLLRETFDDGPSSLTEFVSKFINLNAMLYQAGWKMSPMKFISICAFSGAGVAVLYALFVPFRAVTPIIAMIGIAAPLAVLIFAKGRRMKKFDAQLPGALDLIGQALRAGQSLPAGLQLVAQQTEDPLGPEFQRAFEQQNLGVPLEEALMEVTQRIPSLDLQFFATTVVLQRQTGGDLAEILDKISKLIRERFTIFGQIQALTGEGRLSGIVLLALPPVLFVTMLRLNYDYVMMLFNDPLGHKMLGFAIISQVFGALMIKKIITIKV